MYWELRLQGWGQVLSKLLKYYKYFYVGIKYEYKYNIMVFLTTVLTYSYMFVNVYLSTSKSTIAKVIFN